MRIDCDKAEKRPWVFDSSHEIARVRIPTADYRLSNHPGLCLVERKSIDDLAQTLTRGRDRFFDEIIRMKKEASFSVIIVDDTSWPAMMLGDYNSKVRPAVILATVAAIEFDFGVPVHFTSTRGAATRLAIAFFERALRQAGKA